jgi:preprotein translocase subunit SecB
MPAPAVPLRAPDHCRRNPLMIDPIDFAQMFQQKIAEDQAASKVQVS